jgi:hypothetical protein
LIANEKILADHNITSLTNWLHSAADATGQETQCDTDEERARFAEQDFEGVINADFLLYYSEDLTDISLDGTEGDEPIKHEPFGKVYVPALWARGGRHVEFGIALGQHMNIVIIGPRENIFHWYDRIIGGEPQIRHFDTLEEFVTWYDEENVLPEDAEMPNSEDPPE